MKFRVLYVLLLVFSLGAVSVFAQEESDPLTPAKAPPRIYMGPIVGYNKVMNSGGFASFSNDINCPTFADGSGNGFFGGWTFEYLLGDPKNSKSSLIARILYNSMPSSFTEKGDHLPSLVHDAGTGRDTVIFTTTQHVAEVKYAVIDLDLVYRFNLGNTPLGIDVGLTPGFAMTQNLVQKFELIDPANARLVPPPDSVNPKPIRYEDSQRTAIIRDEALKNGNKLRIAIKAGVQYEIILRKMTLIPSINYNFGILNMTSDDSWRVNAIQAGVELRFAL